MSEFSLLCADTTLWDPTTRATGGSLNLCPMITQLQVCTIAPTQLTTLTQPRAWREIKKPLQDMAFLMLVPSGKTRSDQVFGLAAMSVHPCQDHLFTLVKAAQKLMLLADNSSDWPYAFICMNNSMLHVPLFDKGHIGAMMDGVHSRNACSQLHQLKEWKLLQQSDSGVFPEGLNGESEALQFSFEELPLWNTATAD